MASGSAQACPRAMSSKLGLALENLRLAEMSRYHAACMALQTGKGGLRDSGPLSKAPFSEAALNLEESREGEWGRGQCEFSLL